jgi:hypothetical protein
MLLVSMGLSFFVGGAAGAAFTGGALGVLIATARQMRGTAKPPDAVGERYPYVL